MSSPLCFPSSPPADTVDYLEALKSFITNTLNEANYQQDTNGPSVMDSFIDYLANGIRTLNLHNFEQEFQKVFFEVYLRIFKSVLERKSGENNVVPNTGSFRQCFYDNFFLRDNQNELNMRFRVFNPRMNFFFRFLLALKTSDSVLTKTLNHVLSSTCGDALLRLTHCRECSGISGSLPPCAPFCHNVLRGCLVDLTEVGDVLSELATAMQAMRTKLKKFDPFAAFDLLPTIVLTVADTAGAVVNQKAMVSEGGRERGGRGRVSEQPNTFSCST